MKTLNISILNKVATYHQRDGAIVCDNPDYRIAFHFDAEWDAYENATWFARFKWNGGCVDVEMAHGDTVFVDVPEIDNATQVEVGVYVPDGISTTTPAVIPCKASILSGARPRAFIPQEEAENLNARLETTYKRLLEAEQYAADLEKRLAAVETNAGAPVKLYHHQISMDYGISSWGSGHFGTAVFSFVSSSASRITTLERLAEAPCSSQGVLHCAYVQHSEGDVAHAVDSIGASKDYLLVQYINAYTVPLTMATARISASDVEIIDTVREV